jgi:hypothetical protein
MKVLENFLSGATQSEALGVVYSCLEDANAHSENRKLEQAFGNIDYSYMPYDAASHVTSAVGYNIDEVIDELIDALDMTGFRDIADFLSQF